MVDEDKYIKKDVGDFSVNSLPSVTIVKRIANADFITQEIKAEVHGYTLDECLEAVNILKKDFELEINNPVRK